jgi:hypothetical protein
MEQIEEGDGKERTPFQTPTTSMLTTRTSMPGVLFGAWQAPGTNSYDTTGIYAAAIEWS